MALDGHFKTPNPTVRMCHWYRNGQTNGTPYLAFVFKEDPDSRGVLSLSVLANQRFLEAYNGVRHRDDPFLTKRPQHAIENGVWDYLPTENVPRSTAQKPKSAKATSSKATEKSAQETTSTPKANAKAPQEKTATAN